jgi:hypothetical protein
VAQADTSAQRSRSHPAGIGTQRTQTSVLALEQGSDASTSLSQQVIRQRNRPDQATNGTEW